MTRHRARPSFTVEIKRTRTSFSAQPEDTTDRQRAAQALWKGTALAEMTERAALEDVFAPPAPRPTPLAPARKAAAPERRVLPSLIPAPEPVVEPDAADAPEPDIERSPRRRAAAPRPRVIAVVPEAAAEPAPAPVPVTPAPREDAAPRSPARGFAGRNRDALRPGERWKRRLPRVLW